MQYEPEEMMTEARFERIALLVDPRKSVTERHQYSGMGDERNARKRRSPQGAQAS